MKKTIIINLERDELIWVDKVRDAFNLVPMHDYMSKYLTMGQGNNHDPFGRITGNAFSLEDALMARNFILNVVEVKMAIYQGNDADYAQGIAANCREAAKIIEEFAAFIEFGGESDVRLCS